MAKMKNRLRGLFATARESGPVPEEQPLRRELLSLDLLKGHARLLAQRHRVGARKGRNLLLPRLADNEKILCDYNDHTLRAEKTRRITPAAEWLLDNFHLLEEQIRTARRHLPRGYSRQLPHLIEGPSMGFPRVYDMALELISHIDGRIDALHLTNFVRSYQTVTHLKLGELWAFPIMLRLALIENLRRLAVGLTGGRRERDLADQWADRLLEAAETKPGNLIVVLGEMARAQPVLSRAFVAEFWRRTQEKSSPVKLALSWIEEHLSAEGLTIEQLVQSESQHQAATQVSVGNSIGSLRFLDAFDWREFIETLSVVEQALRTDPAGVYVHMDFATRDFYRHTVERIARHSRVSELDVANRALALAKRPPGRTPGERRKHVGLFLVGKGVETLERAVEMKRPIWTLLPRLARRFPLPFYLGGIFAVTAAVTIPVILWSAGLGLSPGALGLLSLLVLLCASQLAVALVNWFATICVTPMHLPRLDYSHGLPATHATLVVVPTLLTSGPEIEKLLESLEVRYLANRDDQIYFALLTDFRDADQEHLPGDEELVRHASAGIQALNEKYCTADDSVVGSQKAEVRPLASDLRPPTAGCARDSRRCIFYLFHRARQWNEAEGVWMGYERKRGKLADLNRCLRGGSPECFAQIAGDLSLLPHIKYVLTLDTDTDLPRDAARQLAATMAHPLNHPVYDEQRGLIVEGYSILQPRVAVSLPSAGRSRFVQLFAGEAGLDPYTRAVSDVYQDVFHEGSFIGKGIYDVDAFELAVRGKFPENRILSHDLLEGSYGRSALVSDVQLYEDFPARYSVDTQRRHRWIRGDWQIATWLLPRLPGPDVRRVANPLTGLSRWKIFDNLRRSLVPLGLLLLLPGGWILFPAHAAAWSVGFVSIVCVPFFLTLLREFFSRPKEHPLRLHLQGVGRIAARQAGQALLTITFLPYDACVCLDAVCRTLGRLWFTRRNLLQWQTARDAEQNDSGHLGNFIATMWCAPVLAVIMGLALAVWGGPAWPVAFPFLVLWFLSPGVAWWISLPLKEKRPELSAEQNQQLRKLARQTWRFFETFVGPEDHWLPPDNFQEHPRAALATRTSPTNIGMALLGTLAAHDFGYLTLRGLSQRIANTLTTLESMERYQGHFYNWYDTRTLKPLPPLYLSTVDNGNLAGLLLTLHSGLLELANQEWSAGPILAGLRDTLRVFQEQAGPPEAMAKLEAMEKELDAAGSTPLELVEKLDRLLELGTALSGIQRPDGKSDFSGWRKALEDACREHRDELVARFPWIRSRLRLETELDSDRLPGLTEFWRHASAPESPRRQATAIAAHLAKLDDLLKAAQDQPDNTDLVGALVEFRQALETGGREAEVRVRELEELARRCDGLARMDFTLLYDHSRELFSIGYNVSQHRLDATCYDLLASEARLASFVAIALGQIEQRHWFALGRLLTTANGHPTLISWSGSMFEYLMPMLVMPSYENTLLDLSSRSAVARQIEYGRQQKVPWGISESGYNLRDADANYQYRAFGVPGLGFKRGLAQDIVIAPYATTMALMVAPLESFRNLEELRRAGAQGNFGLYEAIDYTVARVPRGKTHAVVQSYMAHHQGMTLLALAHALLNRTMQRRFTANPLFKSAELLLHERVPRQASVLYPHELEASSSRTEAAEGGPILRVFTEPNVGPPEVHLLSNSRYHVMVTNCGGGYSRWNDVALTRWREDPTRDCWGTFFYLRDMKSGKFWSPAHQPTLQSALGYEAIFSQGRAEFRSRLHDIDAHTEISVSPEDDVEVRRITLTNHSHEPRTIEVTSYAEIVLNPQAADLAHPAFSNLFVQTEILSEQHAVLCSRRPRAPGELPPWMAHLLLIQGTETGKASFETDRARFIGRGNNPVAPTALQDAGPLSNSEGSPLDPIVAIRRTLRLAPRETATVTLVSCAAATRESTLALIGKYQDQMIADRSFELAWTHGLIVLRHLNASEPDAQLYGRLASALLYNQSARRANPGTLQRNRRGQRNLWSFGISGDLPIVVLYSTRFEHLNFVRQLIEAHAYWRLKGLPVDLVILNEDDSVYRQSLHDQILSLIATSNAGHLIEKPGGIFTRRVDQLSQEDRILLESAARLVLFDQKGTLAEQLKRRSAAHPRGDKGQVISDTKSSAFSRVTRHPSPSELPAGLPKRDLIFFNGLGGFTRDGREYVITLREASHEDRGWRIDDGKNRSPQNPSSILHPPSSLPQVTPAPWVNVMGNPTFGTLVSESGGGYTWSENCHEFRLTPWHNDAVTDLSGEAFYIRDESSGRFWSPTPLPARGQGAYVSRHGFGYSVFEHTEDGITSELWIYASVHESVKFALLKLVNGSARSRRLSVTGYWEWVLGDSRGRNGMHVATEFVAGLGGIVARNHFNTDFAGRTAFVMSTELTGSFTCDRTEFIGRNGTLGAPAALTGRGQRSEVRGPKAEVRPLASDLRPPTSTFSSLSGRAGVGLDACAALQVAVDLAPGQEREIAFTLGAGRDGAAAQGLMERFRNLDACREALQGVWGFWNHTLGTLHVETPEPALNVLANGWLLYQTLSCRIWARSGFYQSSGAFGFRDQLQDTMALVHARPELLREQLLRAAAHQFREGDVQHWWHPPHDRGVRTHFSDDYLWLPYATCRYVEAIGDTGVLDENIPFLESRLLRPDEEANYDTPQRSAETGTLYEHCVRAIRNGFKFGAHGLPLMGCGDWNDGMNLVGQHGKGESVWLAFFLYDVLKKFAPLARQRGDETFAQRCDEQAERLRQNIEAHGWDGHWYRRAYFDDGQPLGSALSPECQIDALPQSWAVLSGAGDPLRARLALEAVQQRLVRTDARLIQLFDPPFDKSALEPGYIKGYAPGVRENGGQYTHAAIWTVMALALSGKNRAAWDLFMLINPILHAHTPAGVATYKVEPYVVAADIYSIPPHTSRGGWTWYTGSAGWMYRLITETLLGVTLEVDKLRLTPRVPAEWKSFTLHYRYRETTYHITLVNRSGTWSRDPSQIRDGATQSAAEIHLQDDHGDHHVEIEF